MILVGGPVLVHTGSRDMVARLIRERYVNVLFAGNGLAAHDIEMAMFGTSLGVSLAEGTPREGGHEHHLRAINRVRRAGSIARAVEQGLIADGIMHACVTRRRGLRAGGLDPRRWAVTGRGHRYARAPRS